MGHNSVVLSYLKSTGIPRVDGLSTGPPGFGASHLPFVSITLSMSYFFTLYFRCRIVTRGSLWFVDNVEIVSINSLSQFLFGISS